MSVDIIAAKSNIFLNDTTFMIKLETYCITLALLTLQRSPDLEGDLVPETIEN